MSFDSVVPLVQRLAQVTPAFTIAALGAVLFPVPAHGQDTLLSARSKGSKSAPVTVYEMADFQCPYCREFAMQTFPALEKEYIATGKVRWVFINLPIPSIHPNAMAAAEFAACAARQDRFWPAHNMLYSTQDRWETLKDPAPYFLSQVPALHLDAATMNKCLQSGAGTAMVQDDVAGASRTGASSTPSFYIEGGIMSGAQPLKVFEHVLDSVYMAKAKKRE